MRFSAVFVGHAADAALAASSAAKAARRARTALEGATWPHGVTVDVREDHSVPTEEGRLPLVLDEPAAARLVGRIAAADATARQRATDRAVALLHDAAHDEAGPVDLDLLLEPIAPETR